MSSIYARIEYCDIDACAVVAENVPSNISPDHGYALVKSSRSNFVEPNLLNSVRKRKRPVYDVATEVSCILLWDRDGLAVDHSEVRILDRVLVPLAGEGRTRRVLNNGSKDTRGLVIQMVLSNVVEVEQVGVEKVRDHGHDVGR